MEIKEAQPAHHAVVYGLRKDLFCEARASAYGQTTCSPNNETTMPSTPLSVSEKSRVDLLSLLDHFHEYDYQPSEPIEYVLKMLQQTFISNSFSVRLRALGSCKELLLDSAKLEEALRRHDQSKKQKQEAQPKTYVSQNNSASDTYSFFYSTLQALNSEEEEDDNWEWDVNTNEVRLLDKCNHAGVGECDRKSEEVTPKLGGSSVDQE